MSDIGNVLGLFVSMKDSPREKRDEIEVDLFGIIDDKFYKKDLDRSILIASQDSYKIAKENDIDVAHGSLGENILIDINPYSLSNGDKIEIGETVLEITQNCTICNSLAKAHASLPTLLKSDRGIFAKVFKSGKIRKGDRVKILKY